MADDLTYVWDWFVELHNSRQSGFAANPISFQEIESFCRLSGAIIPPWEVLVIRRMDQAALSAINKTGGRKEEATEADLADTKLRIRGAARERRVVRRPAIRERESQK